MQGRKNYEIVDINQERARYIDQRPGIPISTRHTSDDDEMQGEYQDIILLHTVACERNLIFDPFFRRGHMESFRSKAEESIANHFAIFLSDIAQSRVLFSWEDMEEMLHPQIRNYRLLYSGMRHLDFRSQIPNLEDEITFSHYKIQFAHFPPLHGDDCYLIMPDQYTVYLCIRRQGAVIRAYISHFINLEGRNFTPIRLDANNIIALLRDDISTPNETTELVPVLDRRQRALVKPPPAAISHRQQENTKKLDCCPACSGKIKYLSETDAFCLDCNWDNLVPLGGR